jgi:two-component sensor histidine kinase
MTTLSSLAARAGIDQAAIDHLAKLTSAWGLLADMCFSDLLLYVPTYFDPKSPLVDGSELNYMVVAQVRPATSRTLYPKDLVSSTIVASTAPGITQALNSGHIAFKESKVMHSEEHRVSFCIPVRFGERIVAIIVREYELNPKRVRGELERVYVSLFERFANMITRGEYPFDVEELYEAPRVGDGVLVLDEDGLISFLSPNGASALHRLGCHTATLGDNFDTLELGTSLVNKAKADLMPVVEEIDSGPTTTIMFQAIPLLDIGRYSGALVLVRDISELRRRDRMLLSKDATIREVHHRVKNNLQTISSLLRLQIRRLDSFEGKEALAEAERRIRSMALVHEILSRDVGDVVAFIEVIDALVTLSKESAPPQLDLTIEVSGDPGDLDAATATPLALVLTELIQNSIEHAFGGRDEMAQERRGTIAIYFYRGDENLAIELRDSGIGFKEGFDPKVTKSLGLTIVDSLITSQLGGSIKFESDQGARITVVVPVAGGDGFE